VDDALHRLLRRQLKRCFGSVDSAPPEIRPFLAQVDAAYRESDEDRRMLERSLELSSQELLQANADIRDVVERLLDLLLRVDRDGDVLDCRVGRGSRLSAPHGDRIGSPLRALPPAGLGAQLAKRVDEARAEGTARTIQGSLELADGPLHFEAQLLPVRDGQVMVVVRDVTEARSARLREEQLQAQLVRSQRMESLGVMAGGVAHELNNVLGPLVALPELMLMSLPPNAELPEAGQLRHDITSMRESALRASAVIQDLLTMARRGSYAPERLDINHMVGAYLASLELSRLRERFPEVELVASLMAAAPWVLSSRHHLTHTIANVLSNAFEAVEPRGRVHVSTACEDVRGGQGRYGGRRAGRYVVLRVRDDGPGISNDDLEHIFEPFYTKKKLGRSGSGLGLSIVYGVARDAGGFVDVRSAPGEGSEFSLFLPVDEQPAPRGRANAGADPGGESILVVDDVPEQRDLARRLLGKLGYRVVTAASGREAVERTREHGYDLVVMDMIMEDDFDGLDAYREILRQHPQQPCVIASGFAESDRVREMRRLGAGPYLQKPYSLAGLGRAVRDALGSDEANACSSLST
jgi:signal transduction histidine kinase/CheY-like chemotaxis protein